MRLIRRIAYIMQILLKELQPVHYQDQLHILHLELRLLDLWAFLTPEQVDVVLHWVDQLG